MPADAKQKRFHGTGSTLSIAAFFWWVSAKRLTGPRSWVAKLTPTTHGRPRKTNYELIVDRLGEPCRLSQSFRPKAQIWIHAQSPNPKCGMDVSKQPQQGKKGTWSSVSVLSSTWTTLSRISWSRPVRSSGPHRKTSQHAACLETTVYEDVKARVRRRDGAAQAPPAPARRGTIGGAPESRGDAAARGECRLANASQTICHGRTTPNNQSTNCT